MSIGGSVVHDLVSKDELRRMVGDSFSSERWDMIAKGREKVPRTELMDVVQALLANQEVVSFPS